MKDERYRDDRFERRASRHMRLVDTFITFKILGFILKIGIVLFILYILAAASGAA